MKRLAPAKINLSLKVLGRRPDGFHDIETLMSPVSLYDEVEVSPSSDEGITLTCSDSRLPQDASNLAWKAAEQFFAVTGRRGNIRIHVEKHIPAGAGLGGGSSDAAAVILLLDALFETGFSPEKLEKIAADVGSDVAFFIRGKTAVCRGRGEIIEPYAEKIVLPLLLLKPPFGVDTPWAYRTWKDATMLDGVAYDAQEVRGLALENDLERPVFAKYIFLATLKMWLLEQKEISAALLSGSGATVYAVLHNAAEGEKLFSRAKTEFGETLWGSVVRTGG